MEVKIPKEIRSHKESIFFGLSLRQFICALGAVAAAAAVYLALTPAVGKETAGWLCILAAENYYYYLLGREERDDFD